MYMTLIIIVLPILAVVLAIVIVLSSRSGRISEKKKKINMKMNELTEDLEKRKRNKT